MLILASLIVNLYKLTATGLNLSSYLLKCSCVLFSFTVALQCSHSLSLIGYPEQNMMLLIKV